MSKMYKKGNVAVHLGFLSNTKRFLIIKWIYTSLIITNTQWSPTQDWARSSRLKHFWQCHFFLTFIYFTSLREQDEAYINPSWWSTLVGLKLAHIRMWVAWSTTVLHMPTMPYGGNELPWWRFVLSECFSSFFCICYWKLLFSMILYSAIVWNM